jgi:hypothetical protein
MSEGDLRPPGNTGKPGPQIHAGEARWWEPLLTKWGIVGFLIAVGLIMGIIEGLLGNITKKDPEVVRQAQTKNADAALRPAIDAFYANPDFKTRHAAEQAIEAYRSSLPAQDPKARRGCEGAPLIVCGQIEAWQKQLPDDIALSVRIKFPGMLRQNLTLRANITEALARDQRVETRQATHRLYLDGERIKTEQEIRKQIEWYSTAFERHATYTKEFREFYQSYIRNTTYSFAPFVFRDDCRFGDEEGKLEARFCTEGIKKYQDAIAGVRDDPRKRSFEEIEDAAIKVMLEERVVPKKFLDDAVFRKGR